LLKREAPNSIDKTPNGGSGFVQQTLNGGSSNGEALDPEQRSTGPRTVVRPISYTSNKDSLAHVRAHARGDDADQWQAVRQRLARELGREVFDSWFGKVTLERIEGGIALLKAPSRFAAKWLSDHYTEQTAGAWRIEAPAVAGVCFDHRFEPADDAARASDQSTTVQR
jgi:hypothetical protein